MKLHSNRRAYNKRRNRPEGAKTKNPKVIVGSLAAIVISVVILCLVIFVSVFGNGGGTVTAPGNDLKTEGPFHAWYAISAKEAVTDGGTYEMKGAVISKDGQTFVPADGIAAVFGSELNYNEEKGTVKLKADGAKVKLTVDSKAMKASLFKTVTLDAAVFVEEGVVYVPLRSFFESLGYGVEYTNTGKRLDVFAKGASTDEPPMASLSTDKDTYQVGEKVTFTTESSSPQGYAIVDEKWENHDQWYFESGEVTVSYSVKDYMGNWSKPVSQTITVEGEYHPAARVPVLTYFYLAEDADDVVKYVTTEKEVTKKVKEADGKEKEVKEKKKETKTIKGKYYGNSQVVSYDQFEEEMHYLKDNGYTTLTVSEYLDYADSKVMPPAKSVMILFCNGYETSYKLAFPLLKELGFKANIAPEVKIAEDRSELAKAVEEKAEGAQAKLDEFDAKCTFPAVTFAQLKEMTAEGTFEVGCISYDSNDYRGDGAVLTTKQKVDGEDRTETEEEYTKRVKEDLNAAITVLCEQLGESKVPFMVYPFAATNETVTAEVKSAGFIAAFGRGDGYLDSKSDRWLLERYNVPQLLREYEFRDILN